MSNAFYRFLMKRERDKHGIMLTFLYPLIATPLCLSLRDGWPYLLYYFMTNTIIRLFFNDFFVTTTLTPKLEGRK